MSLSPLCTSSIDLVRARCFGYIGHLANCLVADRSRFSSPPVVHGGRPIDDRSASDMMDQIDHHQSSDGSLAQLAN